MKTIKLSSLAYEMLMELSKRDRKKPDDFVEQLIKSLYQNKK
jgi:predicted CopG family antitoxin